MLWMGLYFSRYVYYLHTSSSSSVTAAELTVMGDSPGLALSSFKVLSHSRHLVFSFNVVLNAVTVAFDVTHVTLWAHTRHERSSKELQFSFHSEASVTPVPCS